MTTAHAIPLSTNVSRLDKVERVVRNFTATAALTGAIPVPGASVAIVAENLTMLTIISAKLGVEVTPQKVAASWGALAIVNAIGRRLFVEGARMLGWAAGPLGVAGISVLGALTAALQTWVLGQLVIAIAENGGNPLDHAAALRLERDATLRFLRGEWRSAS